MSGATFQPQTIDLSASAVQLIRTALSFPKVTFDKTGLKSYDASGHLVLSINADGSAQLSGQMNAQGVILTPNAPGAGSYIQWTRQSDGGVVARVHSQEIGHVSEVYLEAFGVDANDWTADVQLNAQAFGSGPVSLDVQSNTAAVLNANGIFAGVWNKASTVKQAATILDETGASSFLQLLTSQRLQVAVGTIVVTWAAGTNSNLATINHNLGRVPTIILACPINAPAFGNIPVPNPNTPTANTFQLNAETKANFSAYPASVTFAWLVIG